MVWLPHIFFQIPPRRDRAPEATAHMKKVLVPQEPASQEGSWPLSWGSQTCCRPSPPTSTRASSTMLLGCELARISVCYYRKWFVYIALFCMTANVVCFAKIMFFFCVMKLLVSCEIYTMQWVCSIYIIGDHMDFETWKLTVLFLFFSIWRNNYVYILHSWGIWKV